MKRLFLIISMLFFLAGYSEKLVVKKDKERKNNKYDYVHMTFDQTQQTFLIMCNNRGHTQCLDDLANGQSWTMDDGGTVDVPALDSWIETKISGGDLTGIVGWGEYWVKWKSDDTDGTNTRFQLHDTYEEMMDSPWL